MNSCFQPHHKLRPDFTQILQRLELQKVGFDNPISHSTEMDYLAELNQRVEEKSKIISVQQRQIETFTNQLRRANTIPREGGDLASSHMSSYY